QRVGDGRLGGNGRIPNDWIQHGGRFGGNQVNPHGVGGECCTGGNCGRDVDGARGRSRGGGRELIRKVDAVGDEGVGRLRRDVGVPVGDGNVLQVVLPAEHLKVAAVGP